MPDRSIVAIIGAGQMGSAIGAQCVAGGARVITPLAERSLSTKERALAAGMEPCTLDELRHAPTILSIVPPRQAMRVMESLLPLPETAPVLLIDSNALAPSTKQAMAQGVSEAGGRFLDGVIIGAPPRENGPGPRIYVSGDQADRALLLRDFGLDVRILDGPVGTAAALKMCYGGLNKGITALTTAILLAAERSSVGPALMDELDISQRFIRERARGAVPAMYPKAYRWVAEFEEIAGFSGVDGASGEIFAAIAHFFEERAAAESDGEELARLMPMLKPS